MKVADADPPEGRRRWFVLIAGFAAMTAGCAFQYGTPYLIPRLRQEHLSLTESGLVVACPIAGLLLMLVVWGATADRFGERVVLGTGLGLAGLVLLAGLTAHGPVALGGCFLAAGAASASVHAASGRLILGWFSTHERGLAMAIRQTAQPAGVGVAALTLPTLSRSGLSGALTFLGVCCLGAAVLVALVVRDPQRVAADVAERTGSPYRTPVLWRVHGVSALLIVPQFAVATYGVIYLIDEQDWSVVAAGRLFAAFQLGAVCSRLVAGYWSDRVGSRQRPLRLLAVVIGVVMATLVAGVQSGSNLVLIPLMAASVVTASTNGLAYTAVAEYAGRAWAGRALGLQNTIQNMVATATPPALAAVIGAAGYGAGFGLAVGFPLVAAAVVPISAETARRAAPGPAQPAAAQRAD